MCMHNKKSFSDIWICEKREMEILMFSQSTQMFRAEASSAEILLSELSQPFLCREPLSTPNYYRRVLLNLFGSFGTSVNPDRGAAGNYLSSLREITLVLCFTWFYASTRSTLWLEYGVHLKGASTMRGVFVYFGKETSDVARKRKKKNLTASKIADSAFRFDRYKRPDEE